MGCACISQLTSLLARLEEEEEHSPAIKCEGQRLDGIFVGTGCKAEDERQIMNGSLAGRTRKAAFRKAQPERQCFIRQNLKGSVLEGRLCRAACSASDEQWRSRA